MRRKCKRVVESLSDSMINNCYKYLPKGFRISPFDNKGFTHYIIYDVNTPVVTYSLDKNMITDAGQYDYLHNMNTKELSDTAKKIRDTILSSNRKDVMKTLSHTQYIVDTDSAEKRANNNFSKSDKDRIETALLRLKRSYYKGEIDDEGYDKEYQRILKGKWLNKKKSSKSNYNSDDLFNYDKGDDNDD